MQITFCMPPATPTLRKLPIGRIYLDIPNSFLVLIYLLNLLFDLKAQP